MCTLPPTTDTHTTLELAPGGVIAGCRIEEIAGRGGMGIVYRATQLNLGRPVAVKVIAADRARDPGLRMRFSLEARLAAAIDHPNLVPIHAAGEEGGRLYLVMRYVPGTDLHRALKARGRLQCTRAADIVAQVAAGLDAAHAAGLVHRDVKPANVLLAEQHVYLGDFGLTRLQDSGDRITESGAWVGTVDYMSPEHLRGEPCDARSDVYALGCVLFAALTGRAPFRRETVPATMSAHLHETAPRPSEHAEVPAAFDAVIERAMAKHPEDRYPSAGDLGRAALAAAAGEHVTVEERTVATGAAAPTELDDRDADGVPRARPADRLAATGARPRVEARAHAPPPSRPVRAAVRRRAVGHGGRGHAHAAATRTAPAPPPSSPTTTSAPRSPASRTRSPPRTPPALMRAVTRDVKRVFPGDSQAGRASVVATYQGQFRGNKITGYEISDLDVSGGRSGRASGTYKLSRQGRDDTGGRIVLGVKRSRGEPRVALIAADPN